MEAFDGFEQQLSSVAGNEYDGVAQSVTVNVTPRPRPLVLYGNGAAMGALSEQNRAFLREAAHPTIDIKTVNDHSYESEDVGSLCRRGLIAFETASPEQVDALRNAYQPVYQWLRQDAATADFSIGSNNSRVPCRSTRRSTAPPSARLPPPMLPLRAYRPRSTYLHREHHSRRSQSGGVTTRRVDSGKLG
jgi:hypothetical protein